MPVSLPVPNSTPSYWHQPPSPLATHRSTELLPESAECLVIGSGISGSSIAFNVLQRLHAKADTNQSSREAPLVLLLEARDAVGGATGRNGGHTKAASYRTFLEHRATLGQEEALRIARLELDNIRAMHAFARQHGIDCESRPCDTVDIFLDQDSLDAARHAVAAIQDAVSTDERKQGIGRYEFFDPDEAQQTYRVAGQGVTGGVRYEAGSMNAYKFTCGVLQLALQLGLNLQTETLVTDISRAEDGKGAWVVTTPRGSVRAESVVLATNGYTAHLLPIFNESIVPFRGQITAQRPGSGLSLTLSGLQTTYSFIYSGGYEYMIPRPRVEGVADMSGDIVIGGGMGKQVDCGASEYGETDDSRLNEAISKYLYSTTTNYFGSCWGDDHPQGRVRMEWTGIMGATADGLPFVGEVPGMAGVWIAAGFNGHGMVLCLKAAEALAHVLLGGRKEELPWFPCAFWATEDRVEGAVFEGRKDLRPTRVRSRKVA